MRSTTRKNRLAHEENDQLSITNEITRYDQSVAVVKAVTTTMKGSLPGIGMASVERDHSIAPAILELAETRAIARSLRFAGYGVEFCGFEEISHLQNGCSAPPTEQAQPKPPQEGPKGGDADKPVSGGNGGDKGGGNGDARISNKQLNNIVTLGKGLKLNSKDLDQETVKVFGEEMPCSYDALQLALAEKLGLPGYGKDGFGPGQDFRRPEDFYIRMVANIATDGTPVPDADDAEMKLFLDSRKHLPRTIYDPQRWEKVAGPTALP